MVTKLIMLLIGVILIVIGVKEDNLLVMMAGGFIIGANTL